MAPNRIDRSTGITAKFPCLQREGESQAEFHGAVVAGGNPLGTQSGHRLGGESGASSHGLLNIRQLEQDSLPALGPAGTIGNGEERIGQSPLNRNEPSRCVPISRLTAQPTQPRIQIVDASQVLRDSIRHLDATQWNRNVRLPIALDIPVSLKRLDASCDTEAPHGPNEIKWFSHRLRANLSSAFSE